MPNASTGPMPVTVLLDSGSAVAPTSEGVHEQLRRHCKGMALAQPYTGGLTAEVADRRVEVTEQQTYPVHLTLASEWGDVRASCCRF